MKYTRNFGWIFLFVITSCSTRYIQVFETKSTNIKMSDDSWSFENDTVKIDYDFWTEHGVMSFAVFNKLKIPIYIDWKKSSFIVNDRKLDYWIDVSRTSPKYFNKSYYYRDDAFKSDLTNQSLNQ